MRSVALFFIVINFFGASHVYAKSCQEVRMAFDIGSGSTKMMVAEVDVCLKKIKTILQKESRQVSYTEDYEKNSDQSLSPAIIEKGYLVLSELLVKGKALKPKKIYGVATSVFRKAKNGKQVISDFSKKLKIKLDVISQIQEAELGYISAKSLVSEKNIIVWDIGGGSMQMFNINEKKEKAQYLGDLASVGFKNMVIEVLQSKNIQTTTSPNPISEKREQAISLARAYARLHVPENIKSIIKTHVVVGVGGVHSQSVKNQLSLKEATYSIDDINKVGKSQSSKSDQELNGDYRSTDVTNLLLVQGFMEALGIKNVQVVDASLLQGALLY